MKATPRKILRAERLLREAAVEYATALNHYRGGNQSLNGVNMCAARLADAACAFASAPEPVIGDALATVNGVVK